MQPAARGEDHCTSSLRFVRCKAAGWTGDSKSKIGNTCKWHAGEMDVSNIMVGGEYRHFVQLKKCTWIKCCYGKKHYGDPPLIRCAQRQSTT